MFNLLSDASHLSHISHPFSPKISQKTSLEKKILGAALFTMGSLVTCGGLAVFYTYFAAKKQASESKISLAQIQLQSFSDRYGHELNAAAKINLVKIQAVFSKHYFYAENGEIHIFYDQLTELTLAIRHKDECKKIWGVFLAHLHQAKIHTPFCKLIPLNLTPQMRYLDNPNLETPRKFHVENFDFSGHRKKRDLKEISNILNETFWGHFPVILLKANLYRKNRSLLVARDLSSGEFVGVTFIDKNTRNKCVHISRVARKANAYKGIGSAILQYLDKEYFSSYNAMLEVGEKNPAQKLYKKYGFKIIRPSDQRTWLCMVRPMSQPI